MSYVRSGNVVPVRWDPDKKQIAREAVSNVVGKPEEWPADVSYKESREIREEYQKLIKDSQ